MPNETIRVMVSSRVKTRFAGTAEDGLESLEDLRQALKRDLEGLRLGGLPVFSVWLNEVEPASGVNYTTWVDECLEQVDKASIVIVLFSGEAGTTGPGADLGICRAEFERARSSPTGRNYYFDVRDLVTLKAIRGDSARNADFVAVWEDEELYAPRPRDIESLRTVITETLCSQVITGAHRQLKLTTSPAAAVELAWAALPYEERREKILNAGSEAVGDFAHTRIAVQSIAGSAVLVRLACAPDALSVVRSREELGRPHLDDLGCAAALVSSGAIGPINLILIRGSATLAQARSLIGDPDAFVIKTSFGAWAAERVYGAQIALVAGCLDAGSTRQQIQLTLDWISRRNSHQALQNARRRSTICIATSNDLQ